MPPHGADSSGEDPAGCTVETIDRGTTYSAQVRGLHSTINIGFNEVEAELQDGTVMRVQGMLKEPVGTASSTGGSVKHQFVDGSLAPISAGETSIEDRNFKLAFTSTQCTPEQTALGAVHLSVHLIRKANGGS